MRKIFKNYKSSLLLILSMILGTIIGLIFKEKASILKPFGDIFINLLLTIIIPLIFLNLTTSIGKLKNPKRIGKLLTTIIIVFIVTSIISALIGILASKINLVNLNNTDSILNNIEITQTKKEEINLVERVVNGITTNDFVNLLSKDNIIALIIFSILVGIAIIISKDKGILALNVLDSFNNILDNLLKIIMYYAPVGIMCYIANFIGTFGSSIVVGYIRTLLIYIVVTLIIYFIVYSVYVYIFGGKEVLVKYWKNIIPVTITSLSTCSSNVCIPINIETSKRIGINKDIASSTITLGSSFHKDGSVVGSVFKIMFLAYLFNIDVSFSKVFIVSLISTLVITGIPIGGGTISEMLIISLMGYPMFALPILTLIATIIDAPATLLNVVGDTASSVIVSRIVDGKNHIKKTT